MSNLSDADKVNRSIIEQVEEAVIESITVINKIISTSNMVPMKIYLVLDKLLVLNSIIYTLGYLSIYLGKNASTKGYYKYFFEVKESYDTS